jgi:Mandelate racemase / muconate lactonizing enzyme, N-terminal domain
MAGPSIDRVGLSLIESPIKMARLQGVGNVKGTVKRVLIELTASDGIVGWGEVAPREVFAGTAEGAFSAIDVYLRSIIVGKLVRRVRALMVELDRALVDHMEAKAVIEKWRCSISSASLRACRSLICWLAACATRSRCHSPSPIRISPPTSTGCAGCAVPCR